MCAVGLWHGWCGEDSVLLVPANICMKAALADWLSVMCLCTSVESDYSPCERCDGKHPDPPRGVDGFSCVPSPISQKKKKKFQNPKFTRNYLSSMLLLSGFTELFVRLLNCPGKW